MKMAIFCKCCFALLMLQISVNAAPHVDDESIPPVLSQTEEKEKHSHNTEPNLDNEPYGINENSDKLATEFNNNKRHKRMYNYFAPPFFNYPSYERNNPYDQSIYGPEDPYLQIYRKVQDLANAVKQPQQPPPPVFNQYPIYLPVIYYIPQIGCGCQPPNNNGSIPGIDNRVPPEMEDERQNWGLLVNQTLPEETGDGSRPISLVPIPPSRPMTMRPPPVEHGSSQAGAPSPVQTTTTVSPEDISLMPTACDGAVLSCCQTQVTYECFVQRGCLEPTLISNNPCDNDIILDVIKKFAMFYGRRTG